MRTIGRVLFAHPVFTTLVLGALSLVADVSEIAGAQATTLLKAISVCAVLAFAVAVLLVVRLYRWPWTSDTWLDEVDFARDGSRTERSFIGMIPQVRTVEYLTWACAPSVALEVSVNDQPATVYEGGDERPIWLRSKLPPWQRAALKVIARVPAGNPPYRCRVFLPVRELTMRARFELAPQHVLVTEIVDGTPLVAAQLQPINGQVSFTRKNPRIGNEYRLEPK